MAERIPHPFPVALGIVRPGNVDDFVRDFAGALANGFGIVDDVVDLTVFAAEVAELTNATHEEELERVAHVCLIAAREAVRVHAEARN